MNLSRIADDMTVNVDNPKGSTKNTSKLLEGISGLARSVDAGSMYKNQFYFYILAMNTWTLKLKIQYFYNI